MIVRGARRVLGVLLHFRSSSNREESTKEDIETRRNLNTFEHHQEPQNNEGKTTGMSPAIGIASPRRDGVFKRELDPYTPASPVKDLVTRIADEARPIEVANSARKRGSEQSRDNEARSAGTLGEVLFGNVESVDEWMNPFPILGVVAVRPTGR